MNYLANWWKGAEHPPRTAKINGRIIILSGENSSRHWSSNIVHAIVEFYIRHWQWLIGSLLAILLAVFVRK